MNNIPLANLTKLRRRVKMTQGEHSQQYIDKLQTDREIPFLLATFRLDEYPDGDFIGVYSSFQNFGVDPDFCMDKLHEIVDKLKQDWDLPTKTELEEVKQNGTTSKNPRYWGIREF